MKKAISTDKAPAAVGPYSQAIDTGDLVFCSGQLGIDPATGQIPDGVVPQTEQAFSNIKEVLAEAGLEMDDIVKVTVLLDDIDDFGTVNEVYAKKFNQPFPARSAFAVDKLPLGGLVEIEVIAKRP